MVDRYTKAVLTVIAVALVSIVVQNSISSSVAQSQIQRVQICDNNGACAGVRVTRASTNALAVLTFPHP
jgi:hypothetical protein